MGEGMDLIDRAFTAPEQPTEQPPSLALGILLAVVVGLLIGVLLVLPAVTLSRTSTPVTVSVMTADRIVNDLRTAGFTVEGMDERAADTFVTSYNGRIDGVEAGAVLFTDNAEAQEWTDVLTQLGGIAVVNDRWAISLDSDGSGGTPYRQSQNLAAQIANKLGGRVIDTMGRDR